MPTLAIAAFGVQLRLGDGVAPAPLTVTGGTAATPIVLTTSAPHGVVDVTFGVVAGVQGLTGANGSWVLERTGASTLKLRGSVGGGAWTSGGTITMDSTYTVVAEVTDVADLGATAQLVNVTAHDAASNWGAQIPTFLDTGNMRVRLNHVPTHGTHDGSTGLWYLLKERLRRPIMLVLPDSTTGSLKTVWHMTAYTTNWRETMPVNAALTAQVDLTGAGDLALGVA